MNTLVTHSLYVKLSKNSKDYGEPDITYQLAGCAEQRPLGIPMGDACSARTLWPGITKIIVK